MQRVENRAEWDEMLIAPFASRGRAVVHKPSQAEIENEGADFMNFMGTMTG